jgi:hypothetical protein
VEAAELEPGEPGTGSSRRIDERGCGVHVDRAVLDALAQQPQAALHIAAVAVGDEPRVAVVDDRSAAVADRPRRDGCLAEVVDAVRHQARPPGELQHVRELDGGDDLAPVRSLDPVLGQFLYDEVSDAVGPGGVRGAGDEGPQDVEATGLAHVVQGG